MTTIPRSRKDGPGRPLPAPDPAASRRAHRLTNPTELGLLLRSERAARVLTQADMAARLGITRQMLVSLENGAEGVGIGTVLRLLADLGVTVLALPANAMENLPAALGLGQKTE